MKSKYILMAVVFGTLLAGAFAAGLFWREQGTEPVFVQQTRDEEFVLAPEVEAVVQRKLSLVEEMLEDERIIQSVQRANEQHQAFSESDIVKLDEQWRQSKGVTEFIRPFLTNDTAHRLLQFQEDYPGFSEIFITDQYGLNVGQTNKTTDYYQADEEWWQGAFSKATGVSFHGPIEFDESSQVEAISLYVPVRHPSTGKAIGVAKAVISVAAIKLEL